MFLLKINLFLLGLTSLMVIPEFNGFSTHHIFLLISLVLSLYLFFYKLIKTSIKFSSQELLAFAVGLVYYGSTLFGALNSEQIEGMLSSQIFIISFVLLFILYKLDYRLILILLKGFVLSGIITSIYIILDTIYFYTGHFKSLNEVIFPNVFLGEIDHTLRNYFSLFGLILFRPAGFSWDPGLTVTGVVLSVVIVLEKIINFNHKRLFVFLMSLSILLSFSRTSIITLCIYFFIKIMKIDKINIQFNSKIKISTLNSIIIFYILFILIIGLLIPYNDTTPLSLGSIRHLKYFSSVFYYVYDFNNPFNLLFGYGYKGVGVFFNKNVDWLKETGNFIFKPGLNPECTLVNIFFYGGIIGSIFWIYTFLLTLHYGDTKIKLLLFTLINLAYGYAINSVWFNISYSFIIVYVLGKTVCPWELGLENK